MSGLRGNAATGVSFLKCNNCRREYPIADGMPILLTDPSLRTQLEDVDYDGMHHVNADSSAHLFESWA